MVAFGSPAAIVAYQWGVVRSGLTAHFWGVSRLALLLLPVAAALCAARFNAAPPAADKRYFEGLPSPSYRRPDRGGRFRVVLQAVCTSRYWPG